MPLLFVHNDITAMDTDAIVNAANSALQMGGGVCGAVFAAAGASELQSACDKIGFCATGHAVITPGFALKARYVIHAVGPVWRGGDQNEAELLRGAYRSSLALADEHGLTSIAFPLISSGIFGYPGESALRIAVDTIAEYLLDHDLTVYLVFFSRAAMQLEDKLAGKLGSYIDDHFVPSPSKKGRCGSTCYIKQLEQPAFAEQKPAETLVCDNAVFSLPQNAVDAAAGGIEFPKAETFSEKLFRLIGESGMSDVEVYRRANMDRKLFSKIRTKPDYQPSKSTVLSLALALRLDLDTARALLESAGFALSDSIRFDVIVEFFIREGIFDIFTINEALYSYDQKLLGE